MISITETILTIYQNVHIVFINHIIDQNDLSKFITLENLSTKIINKEMVSYMYILFCKTYFYF